MAATERIIHKDWPPLILASTASWEIAGPAGDIAAALASYSVKSAEAIPVPAQPFLVSDIKRIKRYAVSYHGQDWTGPDSTEGTELSMHLVGRLMDGRWFTIVASTDYAGWGCQDYADIRVGDTEESVVRFGLDNEGRELLGYPRAVEPS